MEWSRTEHTMVVMFHGFCHVSQWGSGLRVMALYAQTANGSWGLIGTDEWLLVTWLLVSPRYRLQDR